MLYIDRAQMTRIVVKYENSEYKNSAKQLFKMRDRMECAIWRLEL